MLPIYNYSNIEHQKEVVEYKEKISATVRTYNVEDRWNLDIGLTKDQKCKILILRNLKENTWIIEFTIPKSAYENSRIKILQLNNKDLEVQDLEKLENERIKFRISKYADKSEIKFEDLKELKVSFYNRWRANFYNKLSFVINFKIENNVVDFNNINVKEKDLKFELIESIKITFDGETGEYTNIFENNVAYANNLIYNMKFFNLKQNNFLEKAMQQTIELKSPDQYYIPKRQYQLEFLNSISIEEGNRFITAELIPRKTEINKFKYTIDYYINNKNSWNSKKKEFISSKTDGLIGYHISPTFKGNVKLEFQLNQNIINNISKIKYYDHFDKKLFDSNEGLIKLFCQVVKTTDEYQNLYYSNWKKHIKTS
ncbi:MHO_1580 family protein [Mycoplasma sp. 2261]